MSATPLAAEEIEALEPTFIGPVWQRNEDGGWALPKHTIGWELLGWAAEYLNSLDDSAPRLKLTPSQARTVLWWYSIEPDGSWTYSTGTTMMAKGTGKSPFCAILTLIDTFGPSRFSHWDENGDPVGTHNANAWTQVCAVSQAQTRNTSSLFPTLLSDNLRTTYDVQDGAELIRGMGGRQRIEMVTSSFRVLQGARSTLVICEETAEWTTGSNNGSRMYETALANAAKVKGRVFSVCNAPIPGESSVAESQWEHYCKIQEGRAADVGFMFNAVMAPPTTPLTPEALRIVLPKVWADSHWLDVELTIRSILSLMMSPQSARRLYLNQIVAEEDAIYGPAEWDPLGNEMLGLMPGDEITLGFDGGKSDDATALVAMRIRDMYVSVIGVWEKPDGPQGINWTVNQDEVDSAVHSAHSLYKVQGFYADVALWESYISEWDKTYSESYAIKSPLGRDSIGWDMRSSLKQSTLAHERLVRSIFDKKLSHDGDPRLRRHVLNARKRSNQHGLSFGKESRESPRKVDLYAAACLAHEALVDFRARGKPVKVRSGRGFSF